LEPPGQRNLGSDRIGHDELREALWLDGEAFACDEPLMTRDGGEWVFPANRLMSGVVVIRRVRLDLEAGIVRYLETLRNPSAAEVSVVVELRTQFNGNIAELRSDRGRLSPLTLEAEETGIVLTPATAGHDRLLAYGLCLGDAASRPAISAPSRFGLHVRYSVTVPAGGTAIVLHAMAQRLPSGVSLPLDLEGIIAGLEAVERSAIVNLPSPQAADPGLVSWRRCARNGAFCRIRTRFGWMARIICPGRFVGPNRWMRSSASRNSACLAGSTRQWRGVAGIDP